MGSPTSSPVARVSNPCVAVLRHFAKRNNNRVSETLVKKLSLARLFFEPLAQVSEYRRGTGWKPRATWSLSTRTRDTCARMSHPSKNQKSHTPHQTQNA